MEILILDSSAMLLDHWGLFFLALSPLRIYHATIEFYFHVKGMAAIWLLLRRLVPFSGIILTQPGTIPLKNVGTWLLRKQMWLLPAKFLPVPLWLWWKTRCSIVGIT